MVNLTNLPDDIIRHCIMPFLQVTDQRSLLDTNRKWYEYKKCSWYVTIRRSDILDNLDMLNKLVSDPSTQVKLNLPKLKIVDVSALANVHTLDLRGCTGITDISALANVHTLNLSCYIGITDVSALANVHTLYLRWCTSITDISALANVHTLDLHGCTGITDVSALTNVHTLDLRYCTGIKN